MTPEQWEGVLQRLTMLTAREGSTRAGLAALAATSLAALSATIAEEGDPIDTVARAAVTEALAVWEDAIGHRLDIRIL